LNSGIFLAKSNKGYVMVKFRKRNIIIPGIACLVILLVLGFVIWAEIIPEPMTEALQALQSDSSVRVSQENWLAFSPVTTEKSTGLIIYPGGRVDYRSYAPSAHAVAERGYTTIIVPMPLNLAVFGTGKASDVIKAYPGINSWAMCGHSLGGSMAAQFVYENPRLVKGLVLWASYPASGTNLSGYNLKVTTIYGTRDGLVPVEKIEDSLKLLPAGTVRVEIEGGNHAGFGWYGEQQGDNTATISRQSQQEQVINATIDLLKKL